MKVGICLVIAIAIVAVAMAATSALPLGVGYRLETISGHDYLFVWNGYRGCCVIHAESCPCKSGKDTGGAE